MKRLIVSVIALLLSHQVFAAERKSNFKEAYEGEEYFEMRFDLENSTRVKLIYPNDVGYIGRYRGTEDVDHDGEVRKMHIVKNFSFWKPSTGRSSGPVPAEFVLKANEDFSRVVIQFNGEDTHFICKKVQSN